jgi:hypothetical protein
MIIKPYLTTDAGEYPLSSSRGIKPGEKLRLLVTMDRTDPTSLKPTRVEVLNPLGILVVKSELPEMGDKIILLDVVISNLWVGGQYRAIVLDNTKTVLTDCYFIVEAVSASQQLITKQKLTPDWEIHYKFWVRNPTDKPIGNFAAFIALPITVMPQQIVKNITLKPDNLKISTDVDGNEWIHYKTPIIQPSQSIEMSYSAIVESRPLLFSERNNTIHKMNPYRNSFLKKFLKPEPHLESDHPEIVKLANSIKSDNPLVFAEKAVRLVNQKIKYKIQPDEFGAKYAIEKGEGDCTEFSALFVALCRASGIPARTNAGFSIGHTNWERHATAEFLVGGRWIPVDVTGQKHEKIILGHMPSNIIVSRGNWMGGTITKELSYRYQTIDPNQKLDVLIDWKIVQNKGNGSFNKTIKIIEPQVVKAVKSNKVKIIGDSLSDKESIITLKSSKKTSDSVRVPKPKGSSKMVTMKIALPDLIKDGLLKNHDIQLINTSESTQRGCFEIRTSEDGVTKVLLFQGVKIPPKGNWKFKPNIQLQKEGITNLQFIFINRIGRSIISETKQLSIF